jgi:hypothetical protein
MDGEVVLFDIIPAQVKISREKQNTHQNLVGVSHVVAFVISPEKPAELANGYQGCY